MADEPDETSVDRPATVAPRNDDPPRGDEDLMRTPRSKPKPPADPDKQENALNPGGGTKPGKGDDALKS